MVFVWSNLCAGEPKFTLSQVAINDVIMLFAFAPLVALLLGISSITVPWNTLIISVILFIVVPVVVSQILRRYFIKSRAIIFRCFSETHTASFLVRIVAHLNPVVRLSRPANTGSATHHWIASCAHYYSGVFQFNACLLVK